MKGKAVVLLHGLACSRAKMEPLAKYLHDRGGYAVFNVSYPSTQGDVAAHAKALKHVLDHLDGIEEINFVGHSLGNIVIRHYLADQTDPVSGRRPDRRIKRFVMLSPPNHGSAMAQAAALTGVFEVVAGPPGIQLGWDWRQLEGKLATPDCPFGVIAGGKGDGHGFNPLLLGDNDGIISVETTRLAGAADFALVPVFHHFLPDDAKVQEYTLRFLQDGYFISARQRQPILAAEEAGRRRVDSGGPGKAFWFLMCGNASPKPPGRIAGVDYGAVRIGVAISDPEQRFASPLENYTRRTPELDARRFEQLAAEEEIALWVVGLPVHLDGRESQKSREARRFGEWLGKATGVPRCLLRRAIHESSGGGTPACRRIDEENAAKNGWTCSPPRSCSPPTSNPKAKATSRPGDWTIRHDEADCRLRVSWPSRRPAVVGGGRKRRRRRLPRRTGRGTPAAGRPAAGRRRGAARHSRPTSPGGNGPLLPSATTPAADGPAGKSTLTGFATRWRPLPSSAERIIFISSTGVYGQDDGSWVDEDSPCRPTHDSGRALLAAEEVLHDHPLGSRGIVLRLAGIYGPGRLPRRRRFVAGARASDSRQKRRKPDPR